jgi:hypothetical protein
MRIFSCEEATTVERLEDGPWKWPEVASVMTSDSIRVEQATGLRAANGDPLELAYAVNFLTTLYRFGYAVVKFDERGE